MRKRWPGGKACGPDSISHEALRILEQTDAWRDLLLYVFSDMLYTAKIPSGVEKGITVLLAKTGNPTGWGDKRPITLSSGHLEDLFPVADRTSGTCSSADLTTPICPQISTRSRTCTGVAPSLPGSSRLGNPMFLAKLDIRKAFDSIYQESLAEQIAADVGDIGEQPWEARAWVSLIHASEVVIYFRGEEFRIPQSNGVRQGAPDSPHCLRQSACRGAGESSAPGRPSQAYDGGSAARVRLLLHG